jgi:hypothetical protein
MEFTFCARVKRCKTEVLRKNENST